MVKSDWFRGPAQVRKLNWMRKNSALLNAIKMSNQAKVALEAKKNLKAEKKSKGVE